jgi:hypothetical protein
MTEKKNANARKSISPLHRGDSALAIRKVATEIRDLIESARTHVSVTANLAMVSLYWNIGRIITQNIQENEKRAEYGEQLLERLPDLLIQEYGPGYSKVDLQEMRRFSLAFEIREPLANESNRILPTSPVVPSTRIIIDFRKHFRVGWTHYRMLLSIFLGLKGAYSEKDLEAAIVRHLEQFLTELGTDFCFISRQHAMRVDDDDCFLDLPDKRLLEGRLKMYSKLLKDRAPEYGE